MLDYLDLTKCTPWVKRFERGNIIVQAGDSSAMDMYILINGRATAHSDSRQTTEKQFTVYKAGDFFGEMSMFLGQVPTMRVIASDSIIALAINREQVGPFFAAQPEAAAAFAEELCRRLQHSNSLIPATAPAAVPVRPISSLSATAPTAAPAPKPAPAAPPKPAPAPATAKAAPAPPPPKPAPAPAKPAAPIIESSLFPPGHALHELPLLKANNPLMFLKNFACPICGKNFKALAVKGSRLEVDRTDTDLRVHYIGIEPMYYDVVTCPNCWYSALTEMFKDGSSNKSNIDKMMTEYKSQLMLQLGENLDSLAVFAGYYLAIACAPKCFRNYDPALGKLWLKLSRIYDDCQEEQLSLDAIKQALKGYMGAFEKSAVPAKQNQQLYYIIGELNLRLEDYANARKFFFQARTEKDGSAVMTRHAEDRIEYLRSLNVQL